LPARETEERGTWGERDLRLAGASDKPLKMTLVLKAKQQQHREQQQHVHEHPHTFLQCWQVFKAEKSYNNIKKKLARKPDKKFCSA